MQLNNTKAVCLKCDAKIGDHHMPFCPLYSASGKNWEQLLVALAQCFAEWPFGEAEAYTHAPGMPPINKHDFHGMKERLRKRDEEGGCSRSKYHREIKPGVWVDCYDVLQAWSVNNPALQHLIKKALAPGQRGHKDIEANMNDIIASAKRAKELEQ